MLSVSNFEKKYGDNLVLAISKIEFNSGIYWIQGENGSGKSTFFKSLAGLIPFTGDSVFSDGTSLKNNTVSFKKRVGYSEAEPVYPGFVTGRELFSFVAKARNASIVEQQYYKGLFQIDDFYHKTCDTFSSGMLKKLSLSLSFLGNPSVIILDEPLITLDKESCVILTREINKLLETQSKLFLFSSHQFIETEFITVPKTLAIRNKTLVGI